MFLNLNLDGVFMGLFCGENWYVITHTYVVSEKYFKCQDPHNIADVSIFVLHFFGKVVPLLKTIV